MPAAARSAPTPTRVLASLGLSDETIAELRRDGVVAVAEDRA